MEKINQSSLENRENQEKITSKIELRFFRHGQKETDKTKTDEEISLTEEGRMNAKSKAELEDISQAVAFGSPRQRTQETAGLVMAGNLDEITGEETLEELREKLDRSLKFGSKMGVDERLNFVFEPGNKYYDEAMAAYREGRLLRFLIENSDSLAQDVGDETNSTYSRMASSIAQLIRKYIGIAPNFDKLAVDPDKKYENTLHRLFGTHQTVQECFLAKVIEKIKGAEERNKFIDAVGGNGMDFVEGFKVEIETVSGKYEPKIHIIYKKEGKDPETSFVFDEYVPLGVIEGII